MRARYIEYDEDGKITFSKWVNVFYCWGNTPPVIEIKLSYINRKNKKHKAIHLYTKELIKKLTP